MKTILIRYVAIFVLSLMTASCHQSNTENTVNQTLTTNNSLKACSKEARACTNGRTVSRNPANNCEFDSCDKLLKKTEPQLCTAEVRDCPNGISVGRDPYNNCKFKSCTPTDNGRKPSQSNSM